MSSFKDILAADIKNVFMNTNEFAERHTLKYSGETFLSIPVVISTFTQDERRMLRDDHMQGVYNVTARAYFSAVDVHGHIPEKGKWIDIDDGEACGKPFFKRYRAAFVKTTFGLVTVGLEAKDE